MTITNDAQKNTRLSGNTGTRSLCFQYNSNKVKSLTSSSEPQTAITEKARADYMQTNQQLTEETRMVDKWLAIFESMRSIRPVLHNTDKAATLRALNTFLLCQRPNSQTPELAVLSALVTEFTNSPETNLLVFAKNRELQKRLDASLTLFKQLRLDPIEECTKLPALQTQGYHQLSMALKSKLMTQAASAHCATPGVQENSAKRFIL